jgi:Endoribonuclease L-PSP
VPGLANIDPHQLRGQDPAQCAEERAVLDPRQHRAWIASTQHRDVVPEHQDLDVLGCVGPVDHRQPAQHAGEHEVRESKDHSERSCRPGFGLRLQDWLLARALIRRRDRALGTHRVAVAAGRACSCPGSAGIRLLAANWKEWRNVDREEESGMSGRQRVEMRVPGLPEPLSHYTDAMRFGDILFVSGLTPLDENARLIGEGDVVGQARQIHVNLEKVLTHAEASFADVLLAARAARGSRVHHEHRRGEYRSDDPGVVRRPAGTADRPLQLTTASLVTPAG